MLGDHAAAMADRLVVFVFAPDRACAGSTADAGRVLGKCPMDLDGSVLGLEVGTRAIVQLLARGCSVGSEIKYLSAGTQNDSHKEK